MAWDEGFHCLKGRQLQDTNAKLAEIEGDLTTEQAQIAFARFCYANPAFTVNLLMGMDIYPFQDIMIRAMMQKDHFLGICGRGLGKSTIASVFIPLYAIFNPGVTIGVTSATFRQARSLFEKIEMVIQSPKGKYLKQCVKGKIGHRSDAWEMTIGQSKIVAIPLSGDKIRGYRFNLLIIDELLLLSEKVINEVLLPFMAIQIDPRERQKVRDAEAELIAAGLMEAEDATVFPNNKLIGLTSASYEFEYLYEMYKNYKDAIFDKDAENVSHAVMQLSCEMAPPGLYDESNVDNARKTYSRAQFDREYMAQFTGDSSGYYSAKKLSEITLQEGDRPTIQIKGDPSKNYLLAMDPNYDSSEGSDHFAMCVMQIDSENQTGCVVHSYAVAACSLSERMEYVKYLFANFNIVYVIVDKAGGEKFIKDINDLEVLSFKLDFFEADFEEFTAEELFEIRKSYDSGGRVKKIVHSQYFAPQWIRFANETLSGAIDGQRIWFGAPVDEEKVSFDGIDISKIKFSETETYGGRPEELKTKKIDFVDHQTTLIKLTKNQCALIEVSTTATGMQRFDLPANLQKQTGPNKTRKDSYSALVLANWGLHCFFALLKTPEKKKSSFKPKFIA
jgi:ABC-type oligopeptide transport system ATPase subunit